MQIKKVDDQRRKHLHSNGAPQKDERLCPDCSKTRPCCAYGPCNIFCCNCDRECRGTMLICKECPKSGGPRCEDEWLITGREDVRTCDLDRAKRTTSEHLTVAQTRYTCSVLKQWQFLKEKFLASQKEKQVINLNFKLNCKQVKLYKAQDALEQLNTAVARITNNVPTIQTIKQIIGAISNQFQAQQLHIQREIEEPAQAMNACFSTLAEQ
uniref:Uncharacterized protein n=1 Tax=Romanomermis culicivorax TaxID=13658 RepID=A0A915L9S3_ROMCU